MIAAARLIMTDLNSENQDLSIDRQHFPRFLTKNFVIYIYFPDVRE